MTVWLDDQSYMTSIMGIVRFPNLSMNKNYELKVNQTNFKPFSKTININVPDYQGKFEIEPVLALQVSFESKKVGVPAMFVAVRLDEQLVKTNGISDSNGKFTTFIDSEFIKKDQVQKINITAFDPTWKYNISTQQIQTVIGQNKLTTTIEMEPTTFVNFIKLEIKDTHEPIALETVEIKIGEQTEYATTSE